MSQTLTNASSPARSEEQAGVSIVIPVFNEEAIIDQNLDTLAAFFDSIVGVGQWLFIIVDNGSSDSTPEKVQAALERWPLSRCVNLAEPNYGAALRVGLTSSVTRYTYLIDIEQWDLPFLAWSWAHRGSYELFLASKRADPTINFQWPYRRFLSCILNSLLQSLLAFSGTETHGPKLIDREALASIIGLCCLDRGQFDTELVLRAIRARKRIIEIPVEYRESRPNRNWMIKKIIWNVFALRRLVHVMKDVPHEGLIRYYRISREDILDEATVQAVGATDANRV